jgi:hypothetical protein
MPVFHGLNLSPQQITAELNLLPDDAHNMATHLCEGIEIKSLLPLLDISQSSGFRPSNFQVQES